MDTRHLIERLQGFGLDEGEATVYLHLCQLGGARAAEAAAAAQRKRPDTYRLLDGLVRKGFAEKTIERPTRFIPVEIEEALDRVTEARRSEIAQLEQTSKELANQWPRPHGHEGPRSQRFTVFQGRDQVQGLLARMIRSARDEVTLVASPGGLAQLGLRSFIEPLAQQAGWDVRLRLLTKGDAHRHESLADLQGLVEVRYAELPSYHQMIIIDSHQIALFISSGRKLSTQGDAETVLWLNSQDFVLAQKALFDAVWMTALSHEQREAAEREGRLPHAAWLLRGRWQRLDRMRRMASRARGRVCIVAPAAEVARWRRSGLAATLEAQARKGVDVWIWSDSEVAVKGATVVRLPEAPPAVQALVDGRETITVMGASEPSPAIAHEGEYALWSTHPDQVALVVARIEALPKAQPLVRMAD